MKQLKLNQINKKIEEIKDLINDWQDQVYEARENVENPCLNGILKDIENLLGEAKCDLENAQSCIDELKDYEIEEIEK